MKPAAITFDAAQTLVKVNWDPGQFALDSARWVGLALDEPHAKSVYERLLGSRWREYQDLNCTRDAAACDGFWEQLTVDWLAQLGLDAGWADLLTKKAREVMYALDSPVFQ